MYPMHHGTETLVKLINSIKLAHDAVAKANQTLTARNHALERFLEKHGLSEFIKLAK